MTHVPLLCGIHEATRLIDPCPVCARAMAAIERELAQVEISGFKRRASRERLERNEAAKEEAMAGVSKFTDAQKLAALERWEKGESVKEIAHELGLNSTGALYFWKAAKREGQLGGPELVAEEAKATAAKKVNAALVKPAKVSKKAQSKPAPAPTKKAPPKAASIARHPDAVSLDDVDLDTPIPYTVARPSRVAHEDVIAFLAKLPPIDWPLGDAIRLLSFHAIDGDFDDVLQARERIDAHLRAIGEAA